MLASMAPKATPMHDRPSLRQRLRESATKPLHGFFFPLSAPALVEMIGHAGFDFVILDMEHGPAGYDMLEHLMRAATASGLETIVRVPNGEPWEILRALDAGAGGIMVPHVTSGAMAREIAASCRFPPAGRRGVATLSRAARYGIGDRKEYLTGIGDRIAVLPMIEDREALPEAAAIAAVPGVDAVFVGPNDLAASLGHLGEPGHPEVREAMRDVALRARATSTPLASTASSPTEARERIADGYPILCYHIVPVITGGLKALREG